MSLSLRTSFLRNFVVRASALPLTLTLVACGGPVSEDSLTPEGASTAEAAQPLVIRDSPWDAQPQGSTPWDLTGEAPAEAQPGDTSATPSVVIRDSPWDAQPQGSTPWDLTGETPVINGVTAEALRHVVSSVQPSVIIRDPRSIRVPCYVARVQGLEQPTLLCLVER